MVRSRGIDDCLEGLGYSRVDAKIAEWADVYRPFIYRAE
jgi:hypothetical protein